MVGSLTLDALGERGFAGRSGFGSRPALVIVDFAVAFTTPSHPLGSDASREIEETNLLTQAFRARDLPVVYMTIEYDSEEDAATSSWRSKIDGIHSLYRGSGATDLDERLAREPGDPLIAKKFASSFFGTNLHELLRKLGVDTVVIAGCSTSGCVRATAVDSCQYAYRTIVCREAVADRHREAHDQALIDIDLKYGDVLSRAEIEGLLVKARA